MGIGFGGGGAIMGMENITPGKGPKATLGKAYTVLAAAIESRTTKENIYISIAFPRLFYKFAAEIGWKKQIKLNGFSSKDLDRRL